MTDQALSDLVTKLNQIGIALSSETNLDRLLELVVREVRGFTRADAGSLYIRTDDGLQFEVAQCDTLARRDGSGEESFRPYPLPLTRTSIAGFVALTGQVLNIEDVYELEADESVEFSFNRDFDNRNNYRSKSMLVIPMQDPRHENIGVLQLINALDDDGQVVQFPRDVEPLALSLASQAAVAVSNAKLINDIKNVFAALVRYSASAIDARSPHTAGHSRRVAALAFMVATAMNRQTDGPFARVHFSTEELEELSYAAWLHDIGKIGVREQVLDKSGKVSQDRLDLIKYRFQCIQLQNELDYQKRVQSVMQSGGSNPVDLEALKAEKENRARERDDEIALVERLNTPGFVSDEDLAALQQIAAKTYVDAQGQTRPYLEPFELENLGIRKGNLTAQEYREMQSHVILTHQIVEKIPFTSELARIPDFACCHHEMLNGTGYPNGLKADAIPLQARILGVVDIFDALVASDRPYKKALPAGKAVDILQEEAQNGRLDQDIVDLFIKEGIGSEQNVARLADLTDDQVLA
jgi:HD-GYP domain-containing protein (c-di-GMP phosphodiesterase class II)